MFSQLCELLNALGFTNERDISDKEDSIITDVWIILGGEAQELINENSIFNILCIIMNFDQPFLYMNSNLIEANTIDPESTPAEADKNTVGLLGENGIFYLRNRSEFQRLHKYLYDLTFNRINFVNQRSKQDKKKFEEIEEQKFEQANPFKPQIDTVSKNIEDSKDDLFGKVPRFNILLDKGKEYKTKRSNKTMAVKDKELDGCTFKPNINQKYIAQRKDINLNQSG